MTDHHDSHRPARRPTPAFGRWAVLATAQLDGEGGERSPAADEVGSVLRSAVQRASGGFRRPAVPGAPVRPAARPYADVAGPPADAAPDEHIDRRG